MGPRRGGSDLHNFLIFFSVVRATVDIVVRDVSIGS